MTTRRDRSARSCARCYLAKKKCDKKVPSCSRCLQTQSQCLAIDRSSKLGLPRSAVRYLESRLADVEGLLQSSSRSTLADPDNAKSAQESVLQAANLALSLCTSSLLPTTEIHYGSHLFYPSERPPLKIPVRGVYNEDPSMSQGSKFRITKDESLLIPVDVSKTLFNNYISNVLPKYPCFLEADLAEQFKLFHTGMEINPHQIPDVTYFIISMVLAISSLTSKAHDFRKVAPLSEALHREAMSRHSFLRKTNTRSLQCFLLLMQMALLLPYTSNLWYISGEAMRMAIALGLHQEDQLELGPAQIHLRRMIFWTVYHLERTTAVASGCPLAINDDHISTQMPSDHEPPDMQLGQNRRMSYFLSHVQLSRLQSEIHGVQFFDQALPNTTYEEWVCRMETAIQTWQGSASDGGTAWATNAANHCRLLLHRPCSRNIVPNEASAKAALTATIEIINGYWNFIEVGNLVFSFEYVYHSFQAGMALLYALRNHGASMDSQFEDAAHKAINLLIWLFDALSVRWPVASDTGLYFKELKDTILRCIDSQNSHSDSAYDINLLAELDFMVTQRRIHSVYHRNVEIITPECMQYAALTAPVDALPPFSDDLWEEFLNTGFSYLADDSLQAVSEVEVPQTILCPVTPAADFDGTRSILDVEVVMSTLPSCGSCLRQHLKCDREFPSCGICMKTDRECTYYDVILQQDVSRRYLNTLYERLKAITQDGMASTRATAQPATTSFGGNVYIPILELDESTSHSSNAGDLSSKFLDNWYFGRSSSLALLQRAFRSRPQIELASYIQPAPRPLSQLCDLHYPTPIPPLSTAKAVLHLFSRSVNVFFPTLEDSDLKDILSNVYNQTNTESQDHELFYLILAIGSHMMKTSPLTTLHKSHVYFHEATRHRERPQLKQPNTQLSLLQKTLLISIYLLLSPESGDVWRNLGFAIRLYFDLSHRPKDGCTDSELMTMLSRTLYCLESRVSIAFGRPSLLVIGDTVRDTLTTPVSGTIEELISIFFYRISLLKMQVHNEILSESRSEQQDTLEQNHKNHQDALETWRKEWKEGPEVTARRNHTSDIQAQQHVLQAWEDLHYHHTAALLTKLSTASEPSPLLDCDQIIKSCSILSRHKQQFLLQGLATSEGPLIYIYPADWTTACLLFSSGLSLICEGREIQHDPASAGAIRRCLTVLALLEGDPSNLATGLSEILEKLYDS